MIITELSESSFAAHIASGAPMLVEYYTPWCASCKAAAPALERFAQNNPDIAVCRVNVDENRALSVQERVMSVPTFVFYKDGTSHSRSVGSLSARSLDDLITTSALSH